MSDPQRLLRGGANDFEAGLLRAGQADELPSASRRRIMMGLGIGGGALSATTVASGVNATSAKSVLAVLGLGGAVSAVSAVVIWAGISALSPEPTPAPKPQPAPVVAPPSSPTPTAEPTTAAATPVEVAPLPAKTPAASRGPERAAETLSLELAALEESRAALGRREYTTALRLLDDYARRFPKRRLNSEATVLRIEALAARGDRVAATRVGNQFLATHPNSPYARRVKSLIGDADSRPSP